MSNILSRAPELRRMANGTKKSTQGKDRRRLATTVPEPATVHHRAGDKLPRTPPGLHRVGAGLHRVGAGLHRTRPPPCRAHTGHRGTPATATRVLAGRVWSSRTRTGERGGVPTGSMPPHDWWRRGEGRLPNPDPSPGRIPSVRERKRERKGGRAPTPSTIDVCR
jgi:hypothetical protein